MLKNYSTLTRCLLSCALVGVMFSSCQKNMEKDLISPDASENSFVNMPVDGKTTYIVQLEKSNVPVNELKNLKGYEKKSLRMKGHVGKFLKENGISQETMIQVYSSAVYGFTARLNLQQAARLMADPRVKKMEKDFQIALGKPVKPTGDPAQEIPWGITRVGGAGDGAGKTAWIIDSGIDMDHPDLNVDVARSKSFIVRGKTTPDDQHGHGTHVAGTIAALDNAIGVVGVAPGASVVACRVLDRKGTGDMSWSIAALDYIASEGEAGDAVNMSLGPTSRYTSDAYDNAVKAVGDLGIFLSIAAGNETDDALFYSPARTDHPNVYTVSAMDVNDNFAYFSNYGAPVDVCAPGVDVKSCYIDGGYASMSGTSMAAPHVCGLLLLGPIHYDGYVNNDPDGNPDPIAHR